MNLKKCYEDFENDFSLEYQVYGLSDQEIINFATLYDPHPFHLNEEAAAKTHFGRLCASGFQSQVMCFRGFCDAVLLNSWCIGSPGINSIKWLRPWFPHEILDVRVELASKRLSSKRKDRGYLSFKLQARTDDQPLIDMEWVVIILTREAVLAQASRE